MDNKQHYRRTIGAEESLDGFPTVSFRNAGGGSAFELEFSFERPPSIYGPNDNIDNLRRLFEASGINIRRSNFGVSFIDDDKEILRWHYDPSSVGTSADVVLSGEIIDIPVPRHLIDAYLIKGLSENDQSHTKNTAWVVPATLHYRSSAGQRHRKKYALILNAGDLSLVVGDPPTGKFGVPNWSELTLSLTVYLTESWGRPGFVRSIYQNFLQMRANAKKRLFKVAQDADQLLARWLIYRGQKAMNVGDRVQLIADAQWEVDQGELPPLADLPDDTWEVAKD